MKAEKEYLIAHLKEAGIKSQVYTSLKKMKLAGEPHLGAVLTNGETFTRSSSTKNYQRGQKKRAKMFDRTTSFRVVIADINEERCEEILASFLSALDRGIPVNGNWEALEVGTADWVEEGDSILKAKIAVQINIDFIGGIYQDRTLKAVGLGEIKIE